MTQTIDKKGWKKVVFGEVCKNLNVAVRDPAKEGIDRYVGLEHIESGNLHISAWGKVAEGTTFTKTFKPGHVLFGKRRPYLKKAALAEFAGLCSGDILVFEANEKVIVPRLLPFVVRSDRFFDLAIQTSAGSLSPRTKFQDLANYEFLLPPKDQQAKLAELLWAADEVVERYSKLRDSINMTFRLFVKNYLKNPIVKHKSFVNVKVPSEFQTYKYVKQLPKEWKVSQLKSVMENVQTGFAEGSRDKKDGIAQLRMNNVTREGSLNLNDVLKVPIKKNLEKYYILENDVLFNNTNSDDLVGKSVIFEEVSYPLVFSNHFTRLRVRSEILRQKFLYLWLKHHFEIGLFQRRCTKWIGQAAVQTENLLAMEMIIPTLDEQDLIVVKVNALEMELNRVSLIQKNSKQIQKQLINQIFSA